MIRGHHLPGRQCGQYEDVHVALQVGRDPEGLVAGDAEDAEWAIELKAADGDFRGPAVQGRKGSRFIYLTWGTCSEGTFSMFRRAKLMLDDLPQDQVDVLVEVHLTDDCGMPRCGRLAASSLRIT